MKKEVIILKLVSKHFGIEEGLILSKSRIREVTVAKHLYSFLLREHCGMTLVKIGHLMAAKDLAYNHTSVMYGNKKMKEMLIRKERPVYDIYRNILSDLKETSSFDLEYNPKLIIHYPRNFPIREVIQLINEKYSQLQYEFM